MSAHVSGPRSSRGTVSDLAPLTLGAVGAMLVTGSAAVIWALRSGYAGAIYVSGLGATGEPTASDFNVALLVLGVGGAFVALSARGVRPYHRAPRLLRALAPWALLLIASLCFVAASRVTCSAKCPIPSDPRFTVADAVHISLAVAGFALACLAMLLVAAVASSRALRVSSLVAAVAVGVIAGIGGLLSLAEANVLLGGWLEFIAMTLALLWLAWYAVAVAVGRLVQSERGVVSWHGPRRMTSGGGA